ncbi:thiolase family protein [Nocardia pseudovaccinii]|uniref:thiolase family protein n=1 Tax=Nocardia pseudovaccinii TaxID=189540 RepID=UPI003D89F016
MTAHMARYGTTSVDLARIAVTQRDNAAVNTKAQMRNRITIDDHQSSPIIVDPYHLLDCCLQSDIGQAIIVTSAERARDLRQGAVVIEAIGGGLRPSDTPFWSMNRPEVVTDLYARAGISAADLDFAQLYDPFTGSCLLHIEGFGLSPEGEFGAWAAAGNHTLDGATPVNTSGGLLSEGHAGGLNHVVEAVQQLRPNGVADDLCDGGHDFDRSRCRQVRDAEIGLVSAEDGESSLILRRG